MNNQTLDKTIVAFLRKEPMATKIANTDGRKIFFGNTCVGQWSGHHVVINGTTYNAAIDEFIYVLGKEAKKSDLIYKMTKREVPFNTKELLSYE